MISINIPVDVKYIIEKIEENGYEAFIVGGCVRDSILNRVPKDWDITTNAKPEIILDIFPNVIPTGLKHGTVTVMIGKEGYEVTTYRIDGEYSDNRKPNDVIFVNDIKKDLFRRDFTINAIAYNNKYGIIDPFNGIKDIYEKRIKCVGNANDRFNEDYLRMLRAIRFSSQLDFEIDIDTKVSIALNSHNISNISKERIQMELNKILLSNCDKLKLLSELGILHYIFTDIYNLNYDINNFNNSISISTNVKNKLYLKLATLFYDIIENKQEHIVFVEKTLKSLKYDNDTINKVISLINLKYININPDKKCIKHILNEIKNINLFKDLIEIKLAYNCNDFYFNKDEIIKLAKLEILYDEIISLNEPFLFNHLKINGNDLIKIGYKGKEIGDELKCLLDVVIDEPNCNYKDYLINISKNNLIKEVL